MCWCWRDGVRLPAMCPFRSLRAPSLQSGVRGYITFRPDEHLDTRGSEVNEQARAGSFGPV